MGSHFGKQTFSAAVAGLEAALQDDGMNLLPYIQECSPAILATLLPQ